jgi:hypothetical protein
MSGRLLGGASIGAGGPAGFAALGGGPAVASGVAVLAPTTTAMTAWFRADTTVVSGALVDQWTDKSGNARHLAGLTTTRPTLEAASVNGHPSIVFNVADNTDLTGGLMNTYITTTAYTIYCVYRIAQADLTLDAANAYGNATLWFDNDGRSGCAIRQTGPAGQSFNDDGSDDNVAQNWTDDTWQIIRQRHVSNVLYQRINADAEASMATGTTTGVLGTALHVGNRTANRPLPGRIAELIFYNADQSAGDQAATLAYLQARYGL